jgi:16S rRNA (guanine527-N7)-methyltransferase
MIAQISVHDELVWSQFAERQQLTAEQTAQFKIYYDLLIRTNDIHNLTAITDLEKVVHDHFEDSLAVRKYLDMTAISTLADIGTGAGFPAIPLKIIYPHLALILIEVNQKKIYFLELLVEELALSNVTITDVDWRTFLRKTSYSIDLFCARASLKPEELVRLFMPSSPYKDAELVYWASRHWQPDEKISQFIKRKEMYALGDKERQLIFFKGS